MEVMFIINRYYSIICYYFVSFSVNNYIEDVPMKFSDRYLTLLSNSMFNYNDCDDNVNKCQIENVNFIFFNHFILN